MNETLSEKLTEENGNGKHMVRSVRRSLSRWHAPLRFELVEASAYDSRAAQPRVLMWVWAMFGRYGWLLTSIVCLAIGYMLIWQRGSYLDDYSNKAMAIDTVTGVWRPVWSGTRIPTFPVRILSWMVNTSFAGLLPTHEFVVRAVSALGFGADACLLGWLVHRLLASQLAGVISTWLFLMPMYAYEMVLWAGAAAGMLGVCLALLFLHSFLTALSGSKTRHRWAVLGTVAFGVMVLFGEPFISVVVFLPILALSIGVRHQNVGCGTALKRSVYLLMWPLAVAGVAYALLYTQSSLVAGRGGFDVSLSGVVGRSIGYFDRLLWMTLSPDWGQRLTKDALDIGASVLIQSWEGMILFLTANALALLTVLSWRSREREYLSGYKVGLVVFCGGITWFTVSLLFPSVLVKGQILEYRLLYFPTAGLGVAGASLVWMVTKCFRSEVLARLFIAIVGVFLLLNTVGMLGFAKSLAARSELDRKQIAALVQALPSEWLPENSYVVPFDTEENLFAREYSVSLLLVGVFETSWSARAALNEAYGRSDLQAITSNRWVGMRLSNVTQGEEPLKELGIQGLSVPVNQTVVFTYRGGSAFVIESLTIVEPGGSQYRVQFPIGTNLRLHGLPTMENVVVRNG